MHKSDEETAFDEVLLDNALKQQTSERLARFSRKSIDNHQLLRAAVAFVILDDDKGKAASFLLTRRPKHLKRHGGQYALPGGRIDLGETPKEAALRELSEEVGIRIDQSSVMGLLDDYQTRSGFIITPVVVWAGRIRKLYPDANEVAKTFRIPLADLRSPSIPVLEAIFRRKQSGFISAAQVTRPPGFYSDSGDCLSVSGSCPFQPNCPSRTIRPAKVCMGVV